MPDFTFFVFHAYNYTWYFIFSLIEDPYEKHFVIEKHMFLSDKIKGTMLETLDFTLRIGSTPTFLFFICIFNLHAHVAHYVYLTLENCVVTITVQKSSGGS